ncbi:hypothetical protein [Natrinema versiforme]|uniref:Uncharacterized protein n=1 Tax=Natrinema versiforme JCM 10478 TaxID=1227496 RepID=L9Y5J3_9EURY|nr:hypothetical protein [Natrinema versiforme]ELY69334.1 hypothetical protein C489_05253 [Natrinema versiforme JCM 10478]
MAAFSFIPKVGKNLPTGSLKTLGTKIGSALKGSKGGTAAIGAGGGYAYNDITDQLGIQTGQGKVDLLVYGGLAIGAVVAFGQLFDIQIGGGG